MQISYLIPSLYSLGREGDSNNSTSRQPHKSLKNPGNSNAISGMPRIMQRLIIRSAFGNRHRHCLLPYPLVTDIPGNSHCALFLLLPPKNSHGFSTFPPPPNTDRSGAYIKPLVILCVQTTSPSSSLLSPSETPKGLHHKGVVSGHSSSQLRTSELFGFLFSNL